MPETADDVLNLLQRYRAITEAFLREHCDPDHSECWLTPDEHRRHWVEVCEPLHGALFKPLCKIIGKDATQELLGEISHRAGSIWILARTVDETSQRRRELLDQLRFEVETSDLHLYFDEIERLVRGATEPTPVDTPPAEDDEYYPAEHYKQFDISDDRLRQAKMKGKIDSEKRRGNRNYYRDADIRKLWPHLFKRENS